MNTNEYRDRYRSHEGRIPAGSRDIRELCDEIDWLESENARLRKENYDLKIIEPDIREKRMIQLIERSMALKTIPCVIGEHEINTELIKKG